MNLDAEAWDRLITWIDLNVPAYGTYHEMPTHPVQLRKAPLRMPEEVFASSMRTSRPSPISKPRTVPLRAAAAAAAAARAGEPGRLAVRTPNKARAAAGRSGATELKLDLGDGRQMLT